MAWREWRQWLQRVEGSIYYYMDERILDGRKDACCGTIDILCVLGSGFIEIGL